MSLSVSSSNDEDSCSLWLRNFLVISDTGKPIFARYGTEEEVSRVCALLQAIRSSIGSHESLGDIRSLRSGELCMVFMTVNSLTLVGIGSKSDTEAYLRLQLEYIFGQIIFTVTERVQIQYAENPSFDLRSLLGNTDSVLREIVDDSGPNGNPGLYLINGVESLFPFAPVLRTRVSTVLKVVGLKTEFTIFAMLTVGEKILSIVQPDFPAHQMKISDLRMLLKFINRQPGLLSSELWLPVCLPRFSSQDFLFCYTQCMDVESKLCLILVSQQSTSEQFNLFRTAAANIRRALDFPAPLESVLEILEPSESQDQHESVVEDVKWRRSDGEEIDHDEDWVDASGDGDEIIPYIYSNPNENSLLKDVKAASDPECQKEILERYLQIGGASHFLFRVNVPLQTVHKSHHHHKGKFTQCISSPLPLIGECLKRKVWSMYQRLGLRLRLGSATAESMMDAFDMISQDRDEIEDVIHQGPMKIGVTRHCPATALLEAQANVDGVAYVLDNAELFFAMNGPDFEL